MSERLLAEESRAPESTPGQETPPSTKFTSNELVEHKLQQPLQIRIPAGTTLRKGLELISRKLEVEIVVDWDGALANYAVNWDAVQVSYEFEHTTTSAGTVLELVLGCCLRYVIRDGLIFVTTVIASEEEDEFLEFRVYNVRDLLRQETDTDEFMKLVRFANNAVWQDEVGYGGRVQWHDGMLAVHQTQQVHRQIDRIFEQLRAADKEHPWGPERPVFKRAAKKKVPVVAPRSGDGFF